MKIGAGKKRAREDPCTRCEYYRRYMELKLQVRLKRTKKLSGLFFKILVYSVVLHGMICVSMSYILAWMEKVQVVEGVSETTVREILGPVIVYGVTKTVENIFEKNKLTFSEPIKDKETKEQSGEAAESEALG